MKYLLSFLLLFLLNAGYSQMVADYPESRIIPEDYSVTNDYVGFYGGLRASGTAIHYRIDTLSNANTGSGMSYGVEFILHSTQEAGWWLGIEAGLQNASVMSFDSNIRRENYYSKVNVGLTDGRFVAVGLMGGFYKSRGDDFPSAFTGGFWGAVKYPITKNRKVWASAKFDFGGLFVDQFTLSDRSPLTASAGVGVFYML